jgi:hypothetical protein
VKVFLKKSWTCACRDVLVIAFVNWSNQAKFTEPADVLEGMIIRVGRREQIEEQGVQENV